MHYAGKNCWDLKARQSPARAASACKVTYQCLKLRHDTRRSQGPVPAAGITHEPNPAGIDVYKGPTTQL